MRGISKTITGARAVSVRAFHTSRAPMAIYNRITDTIGNTPIVKINNLAPEGVDVYAKLEYFNPLSSVKDRLALGVIDAAERSGALKPGMTVVEATSGNTGVATAMVCAERGYPCVIVMAESFSIERRKVIRMLGAKVILTPAADKGTGMVLKARELRDQHGYFMVSQFENENNPLIHAQTTGPEILQDFAGKRLDYFVTGYGTGGTLGGVGRVLRAARPDVKLVVSEPAQAAMLAEGTAQKRMADGGPESSHPAWEKHPIQGWTPDFVPLVLEKGVEEGLVDELVKVTGPDAIKTAQLLAQKEGIFTGISGGASMASALELAARVPKGSVILTMIPDTAERYLSTPLFDSIGADMNEEEVALAATTPGYIIA